MSSFLSVEDLHVSYGGMVALRGVSLKAELGAVTCIIGPNGAGKSTTLAAIAGGVKAKAGTVRLQDKSITGLSPENVAALGVSLIPEGRHIFASLTVDENLMIGSSARKDKKAVIADRERLLDLLPRLRERLTYPAGRLSGGEQQMLAVARAIMTDPKLLLVDEPSLGLAPLIVEQIYDILLELTRSRGLTLLINEQSSNRIMKRADHIYVLRSGLIRLEGSPSELADGAAIKNAYFGFDTSPVADLERGIAQ